MSHFHNSIDSPLSLSWFTSSPCWPLPRHSLCGTRHPSLSPRHNDERHSLCPAFPTSPGPCPSPLLTSMTHPLLPPIHTPDLCGGEGSGRRLDGARVLEPALFPATHIPVLCGDGDEALIMIKYGVKWEGLHLEPLWVGTMCTPNTKGDVLFCKRAAARDEGGEGEDKSHDAESCEQCRNGGGLGVFPFITRTAPTPTFLPNT